MKNIRKLFVTMSVGLLATMIHQSVLAQDIHEVSVSASGGFSTLRYQLSQGTRNGRAGGDFGVGYTFLREEILVTETESVFYWRWGVHSGVGLGLYSAGTKISGEKTVSQNLTDSDNDVFDLHTTISDYEETQMAMYLNVPVQGHIQVDRYYFLGGVKFGIPLNTKYRSNGMTITNEAYYPKYDNWAKTQNFAGLGVFEDKNSNGRLKNKVLVMLALEGGVSWQLGSDLTLYTGIYFDLGLNNIAKSSQQSFINYTSDHPADFTTNSVISAFTEKIKVMAAGITVRLAMSNLW